MMWGPRYLYDSYLAGEGGLQHYCEQVFIDGRGNMGPLVKYLLSNILLYFAYVYGVLEF